MPKKRYKLYLASGIRLWTTEFREKYAPFFNKRTDLFQPALIDKEYTGDHRLIPIRIATKDLGEVNRCDAILAYMKPYDTMGNDPAGTDSAWECGYAIGKEKPAIMLVEDVEHLDYYSVQWMVTFSIGAILTTNREVVEHARHADKFTHTAVLYCENKNQFEQKIIEYLNNYYRSIYARAGLINYHVDMHLREFASRSHIENVINLCLDPVRNGEAGSYIASLEQEFNVVYLGERRFRSREDYLAVAHLERERALTVQRILERDSSALLPFLRSYLKLCLDHFEPDSDTKRSISMVEYWLKIPSMRIVGRRQGQKKTRPTIFYELFDLVSHHIVASQRHFDEEFVYQAGAIIEIYNWLNTYAIDDVFDNSQTRQGYPTLHEKYGSRRNALLLGSVGHCFTLLLLHELTKEKPATSRRLLKHLNEVQNIMYVGQKLDIELTMDGGRDVAAFLSDNTLASALDIYFARIYGICGSFYESIGKMAMASTNTAAQFYEPHRVERACVEIAKLFGLVQMIRNDLGDMISPEDLPGTSRGLKASSHNDVMEGKLTLPLLYALFHPYVPKSDKRELINAFGKSQFTEKKKTELTRIVWESGAIDYCLAHIARFIDLANKEFVMHIDETPTRLKWIVNLMDVTPLIQISFRQQALRHKWKKREVGPLDDVILDDIDRITNRDAFLKRHG